MHKELVLINCVKILISVHLPFCDLIKIFILILNIVLFFFKYSSETEGAALKCCCSYGKSCLVVKPGCRPPPPSPNIPLWFTGTTLLYFTSITLLHFAVRHFTSLYFTLPHFTSLHFSLLHFVTLLHFTSLCFNLCNFILLQFTLLYFTSCHFTLLYFTLRSVSHFAAYSLCTPHIVTLFLSLPSFASQHVGFLLDAYLCCITFVSSVDGQVACLLET